MTAYGDLTVNPELLTVVRYVAPGQAIPTDLAGQWPVRAQFPMTCLLAAIAIVAVRLLLEAALRPVYVTWLGWWVRRGLR